MKIETIKASKHSYKVDSKGRAVTRDKSKVKYIVIHYTEVNGDTARNEGAYFKKRNIRYSGAHFFVDRQGNIVKSVPMNYTAWSVGGKKYSNCSETGGGEKYRICTNANSVSIELCDIVKHEPSEEQINATKWLIGWIRKNGCKNATNIIRHFDVTGKPCPARYIDDDKWKAFKGNIE